MVSTLPRGGPAHPGSRGPRPSPRILDALAAALRLTPAGRAHLFRLAGTSPAPPPGPARQVRPYVADLLRRIPEARAVVTDASDDVIAWNPLAGALLGDLGDEPNLARRRFLEPSWRRSSGGEEFSHIVVARLRGAADRYPVTYGSPACWPSCGPGSEEFVQVWATNPVRAPGLRPKTFTHPEIGTVRINCDVLAVPDDD